MKNMIKKVLATVAAGMCVFTCIAPVNAATNKASANSVVTSSVTTVRAPSQSDIKLAIRLNRIYNGEVCLFSNTSKRFPLGSSLDNSKTYYVNGKYSGKQCYIFAQACYFYLWNDYPGHGNGKYSNSRVALKNQKTASYESFVRAGVTYGSYLRTTSNKDGSYNGNKGHSVIIVSYNKDHIITLEGNSNGKGKVELITRSWDDFNKKLLKNKGRVICHVISPTTNMCKV